jgi:glc operon protein GlcG
MMTESIRILHVAFLFVLFSASVLMAQLADRKALTLEGAKKMAAAAEAEAKKNNWSVVIVIVDDAGQLLCLERMDGVQPASVEIAIQKARSAALYKRPTKAFQDRLAGGDTAVLRLPGAAPFEGGLPVMFNEQVVGAIGVSGVASQQDGQIAAAGASALAGRQ